MDRKTIIVVVVCLALMFLGQSLINKLFPPTPLPPGTTNVVATASSPLTNPPAPTAATTPPSGPVTPTTVPARAVQYAGSEETISLKHDQALYTFTSHGGGLKTIQLLQYPEQISRKKKQPTGTNDVATLNTPHAAPVLEILGDDSVRDGGEFTLTPRDNGLRAEKVLTNGLRLVKDYQLSSNYLIHATVRLENTSAQPLALSAQEWVVGTATPMDPEDRGEVEGVMWYDGSKTDERTRSWFDGGGFLFWASPPRSELVAGQGNVVWVSAHNQFFALVAMPTNPAPQFVSRALELPRPGEGWSSFTNNPVPKGFQTALIYPAATLAPGQVLEREIHFYAGPKEYRTLARIAAKFHNEVDRVMNFGWVGFFSKALLRGMNWLHHTFWSLSYGWCIIVITLIIKLIFWPVTQAQSRMSRRMAALQPQMKELQAKYKDDPIKMQKKMGEFWKEHKVNPLAGCLPMIIQLPIFFGFFTMIRSAIELRGAGWLWVTDLAKPDTLYVIPGITIIPFISTPEGLPLNPLPLIMGATMFWQAQLMPPSPGMDPIQQKMMKYLPLIFILFLYNYSAGLALYWTVNNLLSILQMKLIKLDPPGAPGSPGTPAKATVAALTPASKKKK